MPSSKKILKPIAPKKKTNLIIQLDDDLKKDFQKVCSAQDMNCSQVLRRFMRTSIDSYKRQNLNVLIK